MAENAPNAAVQPEDEDIVYHDSDHSCSTCAGEDAPQYLRRHSHSCTKLNLQEHIAAYCQKRELLRDEESQPIECNPILVEKVMSNYIIAKKILSCLSWQDRMVCKIVCSTWKSAINTLIREQLDPVDFVFELSCDPDEFRYIVKSSEPNEPMAVFAFTNRAGFTTALDCSDMQSQLCKTPCDNKSHALLDVLRHVLAKPKKCMQSISAPNVVYMPLPESPTYAYTLNRLLTEEVQPFIGGIHIPVIPGVRYEVITIQQRNRDINSRNLNHFLELVEQTTPDRIFKGMLVFVTEKYILQSIEELSFLNYVKEFQTEIPYALAGCIIEDTLYEDSNYNLLVDTIGQDTDYNCEDIISIGMFTVPKEPKEKDNPNFEIYSVVITSSDWTRPKIQTAINEFASSVPRFEHSAAFKLSCAGRDSKHKYEQEVFRAAFPNTPLVGCYGNGELGIDHPAKTIKPETVNTKRRKREREEGIMYSYSTVFMYLGWGKVLESPHVPKGGKTASTSGKV